MEELDLEKEQRRERLKWVFYGGSAMLFVVCGFYIQLSAELPVLHAYGVTVIVYGALLYVEEFEHLKKLWLWKGILATIPLHIAFVAGLFWWEARHPQYAPSAFMFGYVLWWSCVVEMVPFCLIVDYFKPSEPSDEPRRRLKRLIIWTKTPKSRAGKIITMVGENGDDSDPIRESRSNYLRWSFWTVSVVLFALYVLRGPVSSGAWLYFIKAGLLTMLCYGHLLFVEEKDELRSRWLWLTVFVSLPFHVALFGIIVAIDRAAPYLAPNPIVFLFLIWAGAWIETRLMDQIADDYRPWAPVSESVSEMQGNS